MFNMITSAGYTVATLDFTSDLSLLLSGLVGLVWISAGLIAAIALREQLTPSVVTKAEPFFEEPEYRRAA